MTRNNNIIPIENKKPVETVYEIKNETPSFEEFIKNYGSDGNLNYDDLSNSDIGIAKGYGPTGNTANVYKYCYYCKKDVSVTYYSTTYCPDCGTVFGTVSKKTTGLQKLSSSAAQNTINSLGERVERSGGEVKAKVGEEELEITYKRN